MSFKNKVAIVTGGGRGIGRATALALAREGARVVIASRTLSEIEAVAKEISRTGGEVLAIRTDVSREEDVKNLVDMTVEAFGRVDVLVNNAGVIMLKSVVDLTKEEWDWLMSINLTGVFLCSKYVLKKMVEQGSGKIVNVSSMGGRVGAKGRAPYRPSKAAVINFTQCLAEEAKEHNINVNAVCPGGTDTDMMRIAHPEIDAKNISEPEILVLAICPNCKVRIPADAKFCPFYAIEFQRVRCKKCGAEIVERSAFCPQCGTAIYVAPSSYRSNNMVRVQEMEELVIIVVKYGTL